MRPRLVPELICSDLEQSLAFYVDLLGFRVLYARAEDRFAFLEREGAELMLEQPVSRDRLWPRAELSRPFGRGVNFQIEVSDVDHLHSAIAAAGIECFLPLEQRWFALLCCLSPKLAKAFPCVRVDRSEPTRGRLAQRATLPESDLRADDRTTK